MKYCFNSFVLINAYSSFFNWYSVQVTHTWSMTTMNKLRENTSNVITLLSFMVAEIVVALVYTGRVIKKFQFVFWASSRMPRIKFFFCNTNYRQSTISEQVLKVFGQGQNCQNSTFKWPYQLYKTILEKCFFW